MNLAPFLAEWSTLSSSVRFHEVELFRALANHLERHCKAIYVEELHGHPGMVKFDSKIWPGRRTQCELCDLVVVVLDPLLADARVTIHQVKAHCGDAPVMGAPDFRFGGDVHQFELLTTKPKMESVGGIKFDESLLEIGEHTSYTSYGVFYHDITTGGVDYAYAAAPRLTAASHARHPNLIMPGSDFDFTDKCIHNVSERFGCIHLGPFVISLLNFEIGEPLGAAAATPLRRYISGMAKRAVRRNPSSGLLAELVGDDDSFSEGDFRLLVIEANRSRG